MFAHEIVRMGVFNKDNCESQWKVAVSQIIVLRFLFGKNIFILKIFRSVWSFVNLPPLKLDSMLNLRNYLAFQSYWRVRQVVYQVNGTK